MSPLVQLDDDTTLWVVRLNAVEGVETLAGVARSNAATWYE
jgi:hypothetical protein